MGIFHYINGEVDGMLYVHQFLSCIVFQDLSEEHKVEAKFAWIAWGYFIIISPLFFGNPTYVDRIVAEA